MIRGKHLLFIGSSRICAFCPAQIDRYLVTSWRPAALIVVSCSRIIAGMVRNKYYRNEEPLWSVTGIIRVLDNTPLCRMSLPKAADYARGCHLQQELGHNQRREQGVRSAFWSPLQPLKKVMAASAGTVNIPQKTTVPKSAQCKLNIVTNLLRNTWEDSVQHSAPGRMMSHPQPHLQVQIHPER